MTSLSRSASIVSLVLLLAGALPTPAAQAQTEEASSRFNRGVTLFHEGDYRAALIEFRRAYEIAPNYKVLYNLGQTSEELLDYASALKAFEQYLQAGGKNVETKRRTQVEEEIAKLKTRVANVTIEVNVEGAEISVDDVVVGRSPLADAVMVSAGRRKIGASKAQMAPVSRIVDLAGGDHQTISLELSPPSGSNPPVSPTPQVSNVPPNGMPTPALSPEPPKGKNLTGTWIGLSATGAFALGTGIFGGLALAAKGGFDDKVGALGSSPQSIDDARSKTKTFALVTDILGATTIVAGAVTVVLWLTARDPRKKERGAVGLLVMPSGGALAGTF